MPGVQTEGAEMNRDNMILTPEAQADRDDFNSQDYGGCSCCISPPCNHCIHPGNPHNQENFDKFWMYETVDDRLEALRIDLHERIDNMKGFSYAA